jgi:hypothetical protein
MTGVWDIGRCRRLLLNDDFGDMRSSISREEES